MFNSNYCKVFAALSVALLPYKVDAAAFNLNEHSASGLGRAFAGEGAIADNASVLSRNPAAMTLFKRMELSLAGTYIKPNIDLKGREGIPALGIAQNQLDADDIAPSAFIPASYVIQPTSNQWAWGLGPGAWGSSPTMVFLPSLMKIMRQASLAVKPSLQPSILILTLPTELMSSGA